MPFRTILRWLAGNKQASSPALPKRGSPFSVVISTPDIFPNEQKIVCRLLDSGLSRFHLRKPDWSAAELHKWLKKIPAVYHNRIVMHGNPDLVRTMKLGGLHLRAGQQRPRNWPEEIPVSNSCNSFNELANYAHHCTYATLGPVFATTPTAAKRNHTTPQRTPEEYAAILEIWHEEKGCPLLALGGITPKNMPRVRELGFAGFAVVGAVWEAPNPQEGFIELLKAWK